MTSPRANSIAIAALVAALAAGCGGSGGQTGSLLTPKQQTGLKEVHPKEAPAKHHAARAHAQRSHKKKSAAPRSTTTTKHASPAALPKSQKVSLVKRLVPFVTDGLGYGKPTVSTDGTKATVGIAMAKACADGPTGPDALQRRLAFNLPFVKPLQLVVSETAQPLVSYAKSHCKPPTPPAAGGSLVLDQSGGQGNTTTKTFTIAAATWTISYANKGEFFQLLVLKNGKVQPGAISATKSGSGKKTLKGSGRFSLQIASSGAWSVKVRDGG